MAFLSKKAIENTKKKSGNYFELEAGKNKLRVLSAAAWGFRFNWENKDEGKDLGYPFFKEEDAAVEKYGEKLSHVARFVVYSYDSESIGVLTLHQKTIFTAINEYEEMEEYGPVQDYDLIINKNGEGTQTRYTCTALPSKPLAKEVQEKVDATEYVLENAYEGKSIIL